MTLIYQPYPTRGKLLTFKFLWRGNIIESMSAFGIGLRLIVQVVYGLIHLKVE